MPQGYVFFYNEQQITGAFRAANGTSYPDNWCTNSTVEDLNDIGVTSLLEVWPSLDPGNCYNGDYDDDFEEFTRIYLQSAIIPGLYGTFTGSVAIPFPTGRWLVSLAIKTSTGEMTIDVGTAEAGVDIVDDQLINDTFSPFTVNRFFELGGVIYITPSDIDKEYSYNILTS